jgi:hypothetical protein
LRAAHSSALAHRAKAEPTKPSVRNHQPALSQAGAAQAFLEMFALVAIERKLARDPGQRDVGLYAAQLKYGV